MSECPIRGYVLINILLTNQKTPAKTWADIATGLNFHLAIDTAQAYLKQGLQHGSAHNHEMFINQELYIGVFVLDWIVFTQTFLRGN